MINENVFIVDDRRYVRNIKSCRVEYMEKGRYIVECTIHQQGTHVYEYAPGSGYLDNRGKKLWLAEEALNTIHTATQEYIRMLDEFLSGKENYVKTTFSPKDAGMETKELYYKKTGNAYDVLHVCPASQRYRFEFQCLMPLPDESEISFETLHSHPTYLAALQTKDDLLRYRMELHYKENNENAVRFFSKEYGMALLVRASEDQDHSYVFDKKILSTEAGTILHYSGYRFLHRPAMAMKGYTHSKIRIEPHSLTGFDSAPENAETDSWDDFYEKFRVR